PGTLRGAAKAGDTVTLTVGGHPSPGRLGDDLTYAIDVPGSLLADNDSISASVSGEDADGNPDSADAERDYTVYLDAT
ncbi:hypothetical protein P8629_12785, partial [Hydrogenovibrio sp. 3SP14C1]|uniref:hypothetical protein n=1 Tax=Hydrogenovibrio sp. 3SP14C1 TaxID=3038774 RepID=UPI002417A55E